MTKVCLIITIAFLILSCKKDKPESSYYIEQGDITRYEIHLDGNRISYYIKYVNDIITKKVFYNISDSSVEVTGRDLNDKVIFKTIYIIGVNGFATLSIDSSYIDTTLSYCDSCIYTYNSGGFLIKEELHYKICTSIPDTVLVVTDYEISDENTVNSSNTFGCTEIYEFGSSMNIIDVFSFTNNITGRINRNLPIHVKYVYPHVYPSPYSDYIYFLTNNYVLQIKEIYTTNHLSGTETRIEKNYFFEYF